MSLWIQHTPTPDSETLVEFVSTENCTYVAQFLHNLRNYTDLGIPPNIAILLYQSNGTTRIDPRVPVSVLFEGNCNVTPLIVKAIETISIPVTPPLQSKLWVQHKTTPDFGRAWLDWVSIVNCTDVSELLKTIHNSPELAIPKNTTLALYQADGITKIDIADPLSSFVEKSTREQPLVVKSIAFTPIAVFPPCQIPFYRDISEGVEQGSWLSFKHTIPYTNLESLFVRKSYQTIAAKIQSRVNRAIITGTPGIGKSLFLIYLLWRLVKGKKRVLFVYHPVTIYYDGQGGVFYCPNSLPSYNEVAFWSTDLWCLVDARDKETRDLRAFSYGMCKFVLSTSPRREMVNNFRKSPPHRVFDMPLWTETELETIASCFTVKKKDWLPRFKILGGIPRHVLEDTQHEPT